MEKEMREFVAGDKVFVISQTSAFPLQGIVTDVNYGMVKVKENWGDYPASFGDFQNDGEWYPLSLVHLRQEQ